MVYFDEKQKKIITSWYELSIKSNNAYIAFMAKWIAFNAICYNLYYENATIDRANIDRKKSKSGLSAIRQSINQTAEIEAENAKITVESEKWSVDLTFPQSRLFFSVSNNYSEDIIFSEFVKDYSEWYSSNVSSHFIKLKESLKKGCRYYVINMAKSQKYSDDFDVNQMAKSNIVKLCEDNNLKTVVEVLYQIRCNIFHGEKTPGDINDDRIVISAVPLLNYLVLYLLDKYDITSKYV